MLDEATSALDKVNEQAVQDAIDNYRKTNGSITIVVIAHRLSTIKDADKIVVIKAGELIEMGKHDEILSKYPSGTYANFVEKQKSAEFNTKDANTTKWQKETSEVDPEEAKMKELCDANDKTEQERLEKIKEECEKEGEFSKLMIFNKPACLIYVGCLTALITGSL